MGNLLARTYEKFMYPDLQPIAYGESTFDPKIGFSGERKKRVVKTTHQEAIASKIKNKHRDFCIDERMLVEACKARNAPFFWKCRAESHAATRCQYDDYIIRMKEYERERRLIQRKDLEDKRLKIPVRKVNILSDR